MKKLSISLISAALLNACANPNALTDKAAFDPLTATDSRLGPQALPVGECGLFLWGQSEGRPLQFFQNTSTKQVVIPFRPGSKVTRQSTAQPIADGFFAEQRFSVDDLVMDITLRVEAGRNVLKGIAVPAGRIVLGETSGRETVVPVVGLFGCRN
ncbi:MAG: hypothetical protein L7U47_09300 [Alphaproteobacteria bacterium]|nr:hypothetical protein [Alphaproteobacteria bacterium]